MSSIDWTEDFDSLRFVVTLASLLVKLNISTSEELCDDAADLHCAEFCYNCSYHRESCECSYDNYDDYDFDYDSYEVPTKGDKV